MAVKDYNWKRFWCPRDKGFTLADGGFLYDPESDYGRSVNPNLVSSDGLSSERCLILLGEPGIGKSYELRKFCEVVQSQSTEKADVLFFNLRSYKEESRLCSEILQNEKINRLINGTHTLHLFLDSLDECLLRMQTITALLEDKLSGFPIERLALRIACRTAEWPHSFEDALKRLYDGKVGVYELVPLRRADVHEAAKCEDVADPRQFVDLVVNKGAVPLAIKPVTLGMLVNLFKRDGGFPSKQSELYEKGCLLMCEDPNPHRREVGPKRKFSADVLMAVASRIAAATIFGNRYAIWTDIDTGNVPQEDVTVSELAGGRDTIGENKIQVTEELIKDAIATGLFSSRGPHRMGWAHQTYAEFMAARYVSKCIMTEKQIMSLLVHSVGAERKLIPQLYETAAWIANNDTNIFEQIMECDPVVLLRSDVASFETEHKSRLVDRLLKMFEQEKLLDRDTYQYYHKLDHHSLADQVRPYIQDKSKGWLGRRVAIDIAEACKVTEVLPELVEVALDQTQDVSVRVNAACAIERIGDRESRIKLKPLALGDGGDDPDDELKGYALMACWPEHLTEEELFHVLELPKNPNFVGSYDMFIYKLPGKLEETLEPNDLRYGLEWVVKRSRDIPEYKSSWEEILERIILAGWRNLLELPVLAEPFAKATMARLSQHKPIAIGSKEKPFSEMIKSDHERRRLVLSTLLSFPDLTEGNLHLLMIYQTPVAIGEDIPWLIQQYERASVEERRKIAKLISLIFKYSEDSKSLNETVEAMRKFPDIAEELAWLKPVEIDSTQGRKLKARYLKNKRWEKRFAEQRNRPLLSPPPKERVINLLDRFERGEPNAWWYLNKEMTLRPDSQFYEGQIELEWNLTELPVWKEIDDEAHNRIVNAARQYVLHPPDMDTSWVETNTIYFPYMAGYRALALLMDKDPNFVKGLSETIWRIWAPIVLAYPLSSQVDKEPHKSIVKMAYQKAPDEVIKFLIMLIEKENREGDYIFVTRRIEHCWDNQLAGVLFDKMCCSDMKPNCMSNLADLLIEHNYKPAIEYARAELSKSIPQEGIGRERAIVLAESLLANCPTVGWDVVWPMIVHDAKFGSDVFEKFVRLYRHDKAGLFAEQLSEYQGASLYIWLTNHYPYHEDPHFEGAHAVGVREEVARFRDGLLEHLRNRGTLESLQEIHRIAREMPHLGWLKWTVLEAEKNTRAKTWRPLTPEQIIRLAQDNQRTFVEDGRQLLEVVCESLDRLEKKLHDALPAVNDLWDNRGNSQKPSWYPKEEEHLSDYVARHLFEDLSTQRGIIVNREVQIRRGQKTDIHIDAVNPSVTGGVDLIRAIIEVKGCWNRELETAMENQLVGKYLQENQCPNGLYLVGWFHCDKWSNDDYRKGSCPNSSIREGVDHFVKQVVELTSKSKISGLELKSYILDARLR